MIFANYRIQHLLYQHLHLKCNFPFCSTLEQRWALYVALRCLQDFLWWIKNKVNVLNNLNTEINLGSHTKKSNDLGKSSSVLPSSVHILAKPSYDPVAKSVPSLCKMCKKERIFLYVAQISYDSIIQLCFLVWKSIFFHDKE